MLQRKALRDDSLELGNLYGKMPETDSVVNELWLQSKQRSTFSAGVKLNDIGKDYTLLGQI
uniref:Uncharacterized protein n=1 Tax=Setaria digitata TaxID=48799 RepID=A0A915PMQ6_9BILA